MKKIASLLLCLSSINYSMSQEEVRNLSAGLISAMAMYIVARDFAYGIHPNQDFAIYEAHKFFHLTGACLNAVPVAFPHSWKSVKIISLSVGTFVTLASMFRLSKRYADTLKSTHSIAMVPIKVSRLKLLNDQDQCCICLEFVGELKNKNIEICQSTCCGQCICLDDINAYITAWNRRSEQIGNPSCPTCRTHPWQVQIDRSAGPSGTNLMQIMKN